MMLPMERSEVFKILSDILHQDKITGKMLLCNITMSESTGDRIDIVFRYDDTGELMSYLRIVNPPKDCVDGEYCVVYHSSISRKDGYIAIDPFGNIRVYGDDISSFIYKAIKDNANRLADYAKKLTITYQNQVADAVVNVVKTYCEALMNVHANTFDQMDESVSEGCCTDFLIRAINEPESNFQFGVVKHLYEYNIIDNNIWVRFSKPGSWLWTPIIIKPSNGNIIININQCVFTHIFSGKEAVGLARSISEQTGFAISVENGSSTKDQNVAKYIKSLLQKHEVLDTLKEVKEKDECIGCDDVFKVVIDWLRTMSDSLRIRDVSNINYSCHTVCVRNSIGCGVDRHYVTEELKVSYAPYMKSIQIFLNNTLIITVDDLGLGDKHTCVCINKYNSTSFNTLNAYLIACLAEVLKDKLGMERLRAYYSAESKYLELTHCGRAFFFNNGKTTYAIDPKFVISKENIDKMNDENNTNTFEQMKELVRLARSISEQTGLAIITASAKGSTKDHLTDQILSQLKSDWHKDVYRSIYSSVWCTLVESRFKIAAYELEKHFMEYVTLDNYVCFTITFELQKIDDNLPGIEIKFYNATQNVYVKMLDYKSSGSATWSLPLIDLKSGSDESKVYFDAFKKTNCTYKSFIANVVSKIVLLEGLS